MLIEFSIEKKIFIYFPLFILISYIRETFIIEYEAIDITNASTKIVAINSIKVKPLLFILSPL